VIKDNPDIPIVNSYDEMKIFISDLLEKEP
jgi:hypothetical protein